MKYVRIEENTQNRVKEVMDELREEARGLIYQNGCTERDKNYCNNLLNDVMGAIVKVIKDYKLDTCAVTVWNRDTVNPGNIDKDLIDAMWDYRAESKFIIKRKMTGYNLMNRVHELLDYVNYLICTADRTAELEQETQKTQEEETMKQDVVYEITTINGFGETVRDIHTPLFSKEENAQGYIYQNRYKQGADLWSVRAIDRNTGKPVDMYTDTGEPQTQEEYVQPAWKKILAEIDKRREAEKVCGDIS